MMTQHVLVELEMPADLLQFKLPSGVNERLQSLLDQQDQGKTLTAAERTEAEGLVNLAEMLSLLRLRAQSACGNASAYLPYSGFHLRATRYG
ncbi:MAG: hypothetical protein ACRERU_06950, partial [Methylococcales bacterium]